jgi:hypothetical protein
LAAVFAEGDAGDQVDQLAEHGGAQLRAGVVLGQDAFEAPVLGLDGEHGLVDALADAGLLGGVLQVRPARGLGHPEDVLGAVFVRVFGAVGVVREQLGAFGLEAVGDVLEEDQPEGDVLVVGRLHVAAQLVGGEPELGLEAEVGAVGVGLLLGDLGHRGGPPAVVLCPLA